MSWRRSRLDHWDAQENDTDQQDTQTKKVSRDVCYANDGDSQITAKHSNKPI